MEKGASRTSLELIESQKLTHEGKIVGNTQVSEVPY